MHLSVDSQVDPAACYFQIEDNAFQICAHYGDGGELTDNVVVTHEFEHGLGTIDTAAIHVEAKATRRIEVYGTEGTAIHTPIGSRNLTLYLETAKEGYDAGGQDLEIDPPENFPTLLRELAACVRGEKAPDYSLEHDLAVQKALFAGCGITDGNALE